MSRPTILMHRDEIIPLKRAVFHSGKSAVTIRRWCKIHGIARQTGPAAPLEISILALEMVLHSDFEALELLRDGQRQASAVRRYVDHLGLPG
ncbi:MAG: hypothetical protein JHD15_10875 [Phenylobacterium sp.]|uniref:hypothetical protein n=1 Tax=Phenylobacterium sp. TaxID=1871053 RepID=UPI001A1DBB84|nr:hypothetical protein [Phenylobacterium sp.]MBJ7410846.1 hypothetical protein [Phenylobacterium sp.]